MCSAPQKPYFSNAGPPTCDICYQVFLVAHFDRDCYDRYSMYVDEFIYPLSEKEEEK